MTDEDPTGWPAGAIAGSPRRGCDGDLDKIMSGGAVPSQWLQAHLDSLRWLAIACTVVYFCHFLIPVGVGTRTARLPMLRRERGGGRGPGSRRLA